MSIPEIDSSQRLAALADDQLQQELRSLFAVDTQHYLQKYSQIAQSLQAQSWQSDIQELYRCVHTIKGGAVTIGADAVLRVATALEDVLADLRYLERSPSLADDHLSQSLIEAGELLTGALEPQQQAEGQEPILRRIQALHQDIRERYLPQWDEVSQLHQEFATEGLDLVVLELDIALERLPETGTVPDSTFHTAQQILAQLAEIGAELQLATGWAELLQGVQPLLAHRDNAIWRSQWLPFFQTLKSCARQGGKPVAFALELSPVAPPGPLEGADTGADDPTATAPEALGQGAEAWTVAGDADAIDRVGQIADVGMLLDTWDSIAAAGNEERDWLVEPPLGDGIDSIAHSRSQTESTPMSPLASSAAPASADESGLSLREHSSLVSTFLEALPLIDPSTLSPTVDLLDGGFPLDSAASTTEGANAIALDRPDDCWEFELPPALDPPVDALSLAEPGSNELALTDPTEAVDANQSSPRVLHESTTAAPTANRAIETPEMVQIPVPLAALDQSAQHLVETLLTLRTTQGVYQALQSQITQIMGLAQEGAQYITHLRQIQDDYTLLEELSHSAQATAGPMPERYRQGYTVINRLLETSLRLSEIGAETGKTTQQIAAYLQTIDRSVLRLQNTIEDSRLVSFQSLSFRARAILRDLTTRYAKPAQLLVQGEKTELDVSIARNLEPALLHLIRNAYDHGLESPADRVASGKPEQGTITLSLQRQGNRFQFEIQDDGRGMDIDAIQARAETLRLPLRNVQTPAELLAVICQPGFSAQTQVSEISGRGVGMDVVAAQVARLGGRLSLNTVPNRGTTFRIQFPVPRLLVPCVLLQAGEQTVAIPEDDIRTIMLLSNLDIAPVKDPTRAHTWTIHTEAGSLPAFDLVQYWQPQLHDRALADTTVCLYVAAAGGAQGVWLLADELVAQAELIINPIPQPLVVPNGLLGVSLQANGALVPVLEPRALAEQLLASPVVRSVTAAIAPTDANDWAADYPAQSVLIVDDAALMRRRLEASLNSNGYRTHTCVDGQDAWQWLQANPHPNLVITDIEMPNMDGFTLIDRCRQSGIQVPILVVSSRLSEEWFDEASRLGATDYLTKGFSTVDLLKKVSALLNLVAP